ncbi:hypothetical protein GCM10008941_11570 [Rhizomicrobium palustre]
MGADEALGAGIAIEPGIAAMEKTSATNRLKTVRQFDFMG